MATETHVPAVWLSLDFLRRLERQVEEVLQIKYGVMFLGDWKPVERTLIDTRRFKLQHSAANYEMFAYIAGDQLGFGVSRSGDYGSALTATFPVEAAVDELRRILKEVIGF